MFLRHNIVACSFPLTPAFKYLVEIKELNPPLIDGSQYVDSEESAGSAESEDVTRFTVRPGKR